MKEGGWHNGDSHMHGARPRTEGETGSGREDSMGRRPHTSHSMFALAPKMAATGGTQGTMGGMEEEAQEGQQLRIIINKREQYGGPKRDERLKSHRTSQWHSPPFGNEQQRMGEAAKRDRERKEAAVAQGGREERDKTRE